jgi:DNA-binding NtrC family response regulator
MNDNADKRVIMVVDDEENIRTLIRRALQASETTVVEAATAEQAIEYLKSHHVDIAITDIMLPRMKGTDLFYALRNVDPFIQVIMITGYPTWDAITEMLAVGVCDFLIKPFDLDDLRSVIDNTYLRIHRWKLLKRELKE